MGEMESAHLRGRGGEEAAARFLTRRGWTVLARNWRGAGGELDLVAARGPVIAFCEVKTRAGAAEATPTAAQRRRMRRAASAFVAGREELAGRELRLDLLVVRPAGRRVRVRHVPAAFDDPAR
jgi:putative endonuclease